MIRTLVAVLMLAIALPASAQPRMSESEAEAVQLALNRGSLLYYYDRAAWHATDDVMVKLEHAEQKLAGWIVDGPASAPVVVFYDKNEADPHAVYVVTFEFDKLVSSRVLGPGDDTSLSPARKALIRASDIARQALAASGATQCVAKPHNAAVLPPATPGAPTLVYFLTPQTHKDSVPAGGHYRVEVTSDGKPGAIRPFTKSCAELSTPAPVAKGKPASLVVTHLLDPVPTEIHVFTMLVARLPLYVLTTGNDRLWAIEFVDGRARIRIVDPDKKAD